jgi:hypothetical protein
MDKEFLKKVLSLHTRQQIALWVILSKFHKSKGTWFTVAEFAEETRKYFLTDDSKDLARILGGMLSSLYRNGMVTQLTGGRKPVWQVVPELHKNAKKYRDSMFGVVTYWGSNKGK